MFGKITRILGISLFGLLVTATSQVIQAEAKSAEKFSLIDTAGLKKLMSDKTAKLAIFDANSSETRQKDGVIPGAKLLSSYNHYDIAKELPADKGSYLVFYCANTRCTASHTAAERAAEAGYQHVSVLSDGIQGWAAKGETVEKSHA